MEKEKKRNPNMIQDLQISLQFKLSEVENNPVKGTE
jgi:hypothetical protein